MQSLYSAASGLNAQQTRLETIASNIGNSNTPGFKAARVGFKDALYNSMVDPENPVDNPANLASGTGVVLESTEIDMNQGAIIETGQLLDVAIQGSGFFMVQDQNGQILYTRSGSFSVSSEGGDNYLVTPEGYYVLGADGNRIRLPEAVAEMTITTNGMISAAGQEYGALAVFNFSNPQGLSQAGNTCFTETEASGPAVLETEAQLIQGSLERSNVDMSQELTLLIRAQRAYSLASRAVTTTDDMMGLANNMHG